MTDRVVGDLGAGSEGPTVVVVGGVHGSEPAGVRALERFLPRLENHANALRGRVLGLRGNLAALAIGRRYVARDLNRIWEPAVVERLAAGGEPPDPASDYEELRELVRELHDAFAAAKGPVHVIDLHSTSSECQPFFWMIPCPGIRETLPTYGLPIVFDPMNRVSGTLCQYVASFGHEVIIVEGGQHESPLAVDHLEAVLWLTLERTGMLARRDAGEERGKARDLLRRSRASVPPFSDIVHHHKIVGEDGFRMRPGYRSFQPVKEGELLADDDNGPIRAPLEGRILMPLYKPPCDDGFMIIQEREV